MTKKQKAAHYREAASLAMRGKGFIYLLDLGLYAEFRDVFGFTSQKMIGADRSTAFCFMAAMVEAGDTEL